MDKEWPPGHIGVNDVHVFIKKLKEKLWEKTTIELEEWIEKEAGEKLK